MRDVHRGDAVLSAAATRAVVAALRGREAVPSAFPPADRAPVTPQPALTGREEDVLALVAQGLTNQQIARELFVEITTVKSHLSHALAKLGLDSRVQAALWWQQHRGS